MLKLQFKLTDFLSCSQYTGRFQLLFFEMQTRKISHSAIANWLFPKQFFSVESDCYTSLLPSSVSPWHFLLGYARNDKVLSNQHKGNESRAHLQHFGTLRHFKSKRYKNPGISARKKSVIKCRVMPATMRMWYGWLEGTFVLLYQPIIPCWSF